MSKYEVTILFSKNQKDAKKIAEAMFKTAKIKLLKAHDWKVKELTYPIKKQNEAYFWHFEVEGDPGQAAVLQNQLRLEEKVLRSLVVKTK